MKTRFLFPHRYKIIGWIIAIPSLVLGLFILFGDLSFDFLTIQLPFRYIFDDTIIGKNTGVSFLNLTDELAAVGLIVGLLLVAFSRVSIEDEYVSQTRLESLQWAIYLNFALLLLAVIFIHGAPFFSIIVYNMFTPLIFFIIRFHYILFIRPSFEANRSLQNH